MNIQSNLIPLVILCVLFGWFMNVLSAYLDKASTSTLQRSVTWNG